MSEPNSSTLRVAPERRVETKTPASLPGFCISYFWSEVPVLRSGMKNAAPRPGQAGSEIHAAHAAARGHAAGRSVLLRQFGDHGFGGDQESRDRRRVLDRRTNDLGRVDDALGDEVAVFAGLRVEAVRILLLLEDLADDDGTVFT